MEGRGAIFVIFGATGDLSKRKLIPGIYNLVRDNRIRDFHIVGLARRPLTSEELINASKPYINKPLKRILKILSKNTSYVQADFRRKEDYVQIKEKLEGIEKKGVHDRIFYLATGSNNFGEISEHMVQMNIAQQRNCKTKVVYEKPFGRDYDSAKRLNHHITKMFNEDQIYRIDHYLGKELVGTVSILRFTNQIFEPIWNKHHIEKIQIMLNEDIGIDERGPFYDTYGSVRDMVQNHMLQLLALLTMEMPKKLTGKYVRSSKAKLLKQVRVVDSLLGQYEGYTREKGIPSNSQTDTFAALKLRIANNRWRGVPIEFQTGKFLDKKESKILVTFKRSKCLFEDECNLISNQLEIRIHPNQGISLHVNTKTPAKNNTSPVKLDFHYESTFGPNTPEGYENLFADIIASDQTVFTRIDELLNAWKIVDSIKRDTLFKYKKGSKGPEEVKKFFRG